MSSPDGSTDSSTDSGGADPTARFLRRVDQQVAAVLDARRRELAALHPDVAVAADLLRGFLAGGKQLRPQFCWWGWRAGGGRPDPADCGPLVTVAAALELLQACALVHDDLIDRSDTRRGRPSVHRAEAQRHRDAGWSGDADHFGMGAALLLGDLALAWADDAFDDGASVLSTARRARAVWRGMRTGVLAGQWLDLELGQPAVADLSPEDAGAAAQRVLLLKTASYTVTGPLQLGAALAGADPAVLGALRRFGDAVGTAFQLRDDLLGVFGAPERTGKPAGDDLREGKRTALVALARADLRGAGRTAELAALESALGTPELDVPELTAVLAGTAAPAAIERVIDERVAEALAELDALAAPADVTAGLAAIARRAGYRDA